ncbi:MAG: hypothetical protein ABIQ30_11875 [Devosia sp.]
MKIQILVDGEVLNTQIVSELLMGEQASLADFKRQALKAALDDKRIRISQAITATFRLFDTMGNPLMDHEETFRSTKRASS